MTDPWCCYFNGDMDPINKNPSHVSIFLPAPAGSVMASENVTGRVTTPRFEGIAA